MPQMKSLTLNSDLFYHVWEGSDIKRLPKISTRNNKGLVWSEEACALPRLGGITTGILCELAGKLGKEIFSLTSVSNVRATYHIRTYHHLQGPYFDCSVTAMRTPVKRRRFPFWAYPASRTNARMKICIKYKCNDYFSLKWSGATAERKDSLLINIT